jgi:hypothetical protein
MNRVLCVGLFLLVASACETGSRCSPQTCATGCCSAAGTCELGNASNACGARGDRCTSCSFGFNCLGGSCIATGLGTGGGSPGGGSSGGGTAGGSSGGSAGGNVAGGSAGGNVAGGTAGGNVAGGTAGGNVAGGTAGGNVAGGTAGGNVAGGTAGGNVAGGTAGGNVAGGTAGGNVAGGTAGGTAGGSPGTCANTCPGCCLNGICQPGTTTGSCGARGVTCFACSTGQVCLNGGCSGANTGNTGDTCTFDGDCRLALVSGGATRDCVPPYLPDGGFSGWLGGYCSNDGCSSFLNCPGATASCGSDGFCYQGCVPSGAGQGNCRAGYVCDDDLTVDGGTFALCIPDCRLAGCEVGTCNALGYCQ